MVGPEAGSKLCCGLGVLDAWAPGDEPAGVDAAFVTEPLLPPHAVIAIAAEQARPNADMRVRARRRAGAGVVKVRMLATYRIIGPGEKVSDQLRGLSRR
jgi:hypothetical protein